VNSNRRVRLLPRTPIAAAMNRYSALKALSGQLTEDEESPYRFEREAYVAGGLWHPNMVGMNDRRENGGPVRISL
jgi:serine/threonine-protein kinase